MSEKSPLDESWDSLVDDWQSQPYEKVDMAKLIRQLKKRTFWAKLCLGLDVAGTLFLFFAWYWIAVNEPEDRATFIYVGIGAIGSVFYTLYAFKIRLESWRLSASSPSEYFDKHISGIKGAIRYAKLLQYTSFGMFPIVNWYVWEMSKLRDKSFLLGYLIVNLVVAAMVAFGIYLQKQREKELASLEKIKGE